MGAIAMLEPGQVVDRYTVDAILGQGGMAVVYRVRHNQLGSFHALKVLTISSAGIAERLLQEGRVQAQLRHPNIVAVTDVIDVAGQPGLVMEYIDGPALDNWLKDNRLSMDQAERVFKAILAGVGYAHEFGLVHRDLKPANVMLAPTSGDYVPKVADFGLAKALASDSGMQQTRSGVTMGTPAYMAPEQIRDAKNVDRRADMFSLGCILYELVCGRPPFVGPDILTIFNAVASGEYPPAISLIPDLPARFQNAIQAALIVDKTHRVSDCRTMLAILEGMPPAEALAMQPPVEEAAPPVTSLRPGGGSAATFPAEILSASGAPRAISGGQGAFAAGGGQLSAGGAVPQAVPGASGAAARGPSTAPRSGAPLDGTLRPPSGSLSPSGAPSRKKWLLLPVLMVPVLVALVAVLLVVGGVFFLQGKWKRQVHAMAEAGTGGEVAFDTVMVRPSRVVFQGVRVNGADEEPVLRMEALDVEGSWSLSGAALDFTPTAVHVVGLEGEIRRRKGDLVLPERTLALLRGEGDGPAPDLPLARIDGGPGKLVAKERGGELRVAWAGFELADARVGTSDGRLLTAQGLGLTGLEVASDAPILKVAALTASGDGVVKLSDLDLEVAVRPDGLLEIPPVAGRLFPEWLGGQSAETGEFAWLGLDLGLSPVAPTKLEVESGTLSVLDRAYAMKAVRWDLELERLGIGPVKDGWIPIDLAARSEEARFAVEGDLREDGLLRGRVSVRYLPLERLAPYMETSLQHYGVKPPAGTLAATVDYTAKSDSFAATFAAEAEGVAFEKAMLPRSAPPPPAKASRLLEPRAKVQTTVETVGSLADSDFAPTDLFLKALMEDLFKPAGGAVWPTRDRPKGKPRATASAAPSSASTAEEGPGAAATGEAAAEGTGATATEEAPPTEGGDKPSAEGPPPKDGPPPGEEKKPKEPLNKFSREVREALEDFKIKPIDGK